MLEKVEEMRNALTASSTVTGTAAEGNGIDVARAMAALDDLERRVRRILETEA
ncbi:MAG: hypothetical protein ACRDF6_03025 [bacterium]